MRLSQAGAKRRLHVLERSRIPGHHITSLGSHMNREICHEELEFLYVVRDPGNRGGSLNVDEPEFSLVWLVGGQSEEAKRPGGAGRITGGRCSREDGVDESVAWAPDQAG